METSGNPEPGTYSSVFYGHVRGVFEEDIGEEKDMSVLIVKPENTERADKQLDELLLAASQNLVPVQGEADLQIGHIYVVALGEGFARALFQQFVSEDKQILQMYLLDVGEQKVTGSETVFVCPEEVEKLDRTASVRAVRVPKLSAQAKRIVPLTRGCHCKCFVGELQESLVDGPYVEGRVLLEYHAGRFTDFNDLSDEPHQDGRNFKIFFPVEGKKGNADGNAKLEKRNKGGWNSTLKGPLPIGPNKSQTRKLENHTNSEGCFGTRTSDSTTVRTSNSKDRRGGFGGFEGQSTDLKSAAVRKLDSKIPQPVPSVSRSSQRSQHCAQPRDRVSENCPSLQHTIFRQTAFKEYEIERFPKMLRVCFDRYEWANVFFAVNTAVFQNVEREMHAGRSRYASLPRVKKSKVAVGTGCLAYTSMKSEPPSYFRAVVAETADSSGKLCVFLVDVAVRQWLLPTNVIDISGVIQRNERFMQLPVAMMHCRLEDAGTRKIQDFVAGSVLELLFCAKDHQGMFEVRFPTEPAVRPAPLLRPSTTDFNKTLPTENARDLSVGKLLEIGNQTLAAALAAKLKLTSALLGSPLSTSGMVVDAKSIPPFLGGSCMSGEYGLPYGGALSPMNSLMANVGDKGAVGVSGNSGAAVRSEARFESVSARFYMDALQNPLEELRDFTAHLERSAALVAAVVDERRSAYENACGSVEALERDRCVGKERPGASEKLHAFGLPVKAPRNAPETGARFGHGFGADATRIPTSKRGPGFGNGAGRGGSMTDVMAEVGGSSGGMSGNFVPGSRFANFRPSAAASAEASGSPRIGFGMEMGGGNAIGGFGTATIPPKGIAPRADPLCFGSPKRWTQMSWSTNGNRGGSGSQDPARLFFPLTRNTGGSHSPRFAAQGLTSGFSGSGPGPWKEQTWSNAAGSDFKYGESPFAKVTPYFQGDSPKAASRCHRDEKSKAPSIWDVPADSRKGVGSKESLR